MAQTAVAQQGVQHHGAVQQAVAALFPSVSEQVLCAELCSWLVETYYVGGSRSQRQDEFALICADKLVTLQRNATNGGFLCCFVAAPYSRHQVLDVTELVGLSLAVRLYESAGVFARGAVDVVVHLETAYDNNPQSDLLGAEQQVDRDYVLKSRNSQVLNEVLRLSGVPLQVPCTTNARFYADKVLYRTAHNKVAYQEYVNHADYGAIECMFVAHASDGLRADARLDMVSLSRVRRLYVGNSADGAWVRWCDGQPWCSEALFVRGCTLSGDDAAQLLRSCPQMEALSMVDCTVTGASQQTCEIAELLRHVQLRYLDLSGSTALNASLSGLCLAALTVLRLDGTAAELPDDLALTELRVLSLRACGLTSARPLRNCRSLLSLDLSVNKIADICYLEPMVLLQRLCIAVNNVGHLAPLARLGQLRYLDISSNPLASADEVRYVASLPHLVCLRYDYCGVPYSRGNIQFASRRIAVHHEEILREDCAVQAVECQNDSSSSSL